MRMIRGIPTRPIVHSSHKGFQEVFAIVLPGGPKAAFALRLAILLLSSFILSGHVLSAQAAGQACTSYVVVSAFDHKTGDDIKNLNAGDFQARLGKAAADVVSAAQQFNDRLLVLLQTDGTRNEKIEDVVNLATRLAGQAPEGKPIAFGVFVKRALFTKGFITDPKQRPREFSGIAEEEPSLGEQVHLYNALHQALALFGAHQPGDTVLLIADGYDEGSDRSGAQVEKEYVASGTRLMVMLRRTPSHVGGNFLWNSPEPQIHLMEAMSAATGGTYTMFSARDFEFAWQGYMLGIQSPDRNKKTRKLKVQLQGAAAATYKRPNLYYPERLPPCGDGMTAAR
jgi:hypothetical protein